MGGKEEACCVTKGPRERYFHSKLHNPVEKHTISVENLRSICRPPPFVPLFLSSVAASQRRL